MLISLLHEHFTPFRFHGFYLTEAQRQQGGETAEIETACDAPGPQLRAVAVL